VILVAGGTGTLGSEVVRLLVSRQLTVRVLTRQADWSPVNATGTVEVIVGDIRDQDVLDRAVAGVTAVVSCVQGFAGRDAAGPDEIDRHGNELLIESAQKHGVHRFVLISIVGAGADSPVPLFRAKHHAEQALRASTLPWTIVRCSAFMETWLELVGDPLVEKGRTRIFGSGRNPINFVAVQDVAAAVVTAALEEGPADRTISVSGPENLTFDQFAETIQTGTGRKGKIAHIPRRLMGALAIVLRPFLPQVTGQMRAAVAMDTDDMTAPPTKHATTRLADIVSARYHPYSTGA
jgi:NADH dehydrogenase